jgi:hypothetical protein
LPAVNPKNPLFSDRPSLISFVDSGWNIRHSLIDCVDCELEAGSSAECNDGFDVLLWVESSLIDFDMRPNVCRGMKGNPLGASGSGFVKVCMELTVGNSVLGVPSSSQCIDTESTERIELIAIAAVEV